jgi:diaminohydroxyphosphoribosylaminopyrimidine deaminase/5-amino-6-(5-phosphoribosylamino)uracil reductase
VKRVVVAQRDPFALVDGGGLARLSAAGIETRVGVLEAEARKLNAPYLKLIVTKRPWVIAKWAMTIDGKIATRTGDSQWISSEASRAVVHQLRGRVDAVIVGAETARRDNPRLTARLPGPRVATRIVLDSNASLRLDSQLAQTARETPVLVAARGGAPEHKVAALRECGCEVLLLDGANHAARLEQLLDELGRRRMTNVLVEGGGKLLGTLWDADIIDEVHVFIAPKLIGGETAPTPLAGLGRATMADAAVLEDVIVAARGLDMYLTGRTPRKSSTARVNVTQE